MASASGNLCRRCLLQWNKKILTPFTLQSPLKGWDYLPYPITFGLTSPLNNFIISRQRSMYKNIYSALYDESSTKDFIYSLHSRERELLFKEMQKCEEKRLKSEGQGPVQPPTSEQLRFLAFHNALPFFGFGFLDNLIMIAFGEYIDMTLGMRLGISTMAAAGFGNLISDVAGIGLASYVERLSMKFGVRTPEMSPEQIDMPKTRWIASIARAFGVAFGCFIGMFPLLLFKDEDEKCEDKT
ncbi:hypothetical protein SNE40_012184 [Patella caerulea]|uniref:Transmembrane protein 65 n=2 Tax=Patella caerulea TaxID=87958 RepID=A0AAN8PQB2_PATCE